MTLFIKMETNKKILEMLKENSRFTNQYIAKELGVTEGTIRNRIKQLVEKGQIKKFTIISSSEASAICMVDTNAKVKTSEIVESIKKIKGVKDIYEVSGPTTIICKIEGENLADVNELVERIRSVRGVVDTRTNTILKEN
ncbi:hypothetical protein BVX95_00035 [archaeon D22]|nr:hypothetical protein BVX95_00035 [archaeon D22]